MQANLICRKLFYFGYVMRLNCFEKTNIEGMVEDKRRRGRPAASWSKDIKDITGMNHKYNNGNHKLLLNSHEVNVFLTNIMKCAI